MELGGTTVGTPSVAAELALGWVHLLWDDLGAAERHLDRAAAGADVAGDRGGRLAAAGLWSLVRGSRGPRDAGAALAELRGRTIDLDAWQPPLALAPVLETAEARLLAARGDVEAAQAVLDRKASRSGESAAIALLRARLALAEGSPKVALELLERRPEEQLASFGLGIEACVLTAVARHAVHDDEGAGEALENALALAGPNSYRRPFLDGGSAVQVLLEQRIRSGTAHRSFAGELLARLPQARAERGGDEGRAARAAERARAVGAPLPPDDDVQRRDRGRALRHVEHRQDPPEEHLPQARRVAATGRS